MVDSYVPALVEELRINGVNDYHFDNKGRHNKLRFCCNGQSHLLVFPKTPSDSYRGVRNCLSDLRRLLGVRKQRPKPVVREPKIMERLPPEPPRVVAPPPVIITEPESVKCPRMTLAQIAAILNSSPLYAP